MKSKIKIICICLLLSLLVIYGVSHVNSNVSNDYKFIQNEVADNKNQINLKKLNSFEWTAVTIYPPYARISVIEKETLININTLKEYSDFGSLKEGISLLVFWNNEKVASHIFFPRSEFDFSRFSKRGIIKKEDAIFEKNK